MEPNFSKYSNKTIIGLVLLMIGIGGLMFFNLRKTKVEPLPLAPLVKVWPQVETIGLSVQGRKIEAYTYGDGPKHLLFVGGIHGGYEWNSSILAYQFMDYLKANPNFIPAGFSITVVPAANPDGLFRVVGKEGRFTSIDIPANAGPTGTGRFNANNVDLNRNFDCNWQSKSTWRSEVVSAGSSAFSEPEAKAIRDLVAKTKPVAAIFWHSQSGTVYASQCKAGILPVTLDIMNAYAQAAGYKTDKSFDAYKITGDAEGWLASINIPAITVELTTHEAIEWDKNAAGIKKIIEYFR